MFTKILIANRGEIACRVMRTAHALGYPTVAVYSEADAHALHVAQADEAVCIGPAPAADSYLRIDALLDAARRTGADAVHPGYGFLSERADFAQACADAGLVFIGPPPEAITAMGNKAAAKRRMREAGVPCAPGYLGEDQSDETLLSQARDLGLPLLVKAVAGGGGRGMRLVHALDELPQAIAGARREALSTFGDGTLMLERLIEGGRHIEIQVFADAHGHCIHLGERDCTAQRRRQKVIEEAPSPVVSAAMRERMGADAVAAALAVGYRGAGTVEFIVDAQLNHFFLEMNTRLQVEHPVTECVTGLDLVAWQLRIAAGEPLPLRQDQVQLTGHAIEVRLYAEDPYAGFVPQTGTVQHWRPEDAQHGRSLGKTSDGQLRIDHGIAEGGSIGPHYDPLVAKLIAHGRDRDDAIRRLRAALRDAPLVGITHNGRFLHELLDHAAFRRAGMHTTLLDQWATDGEALLQRPQASEADWCLAAAVLALHGGQAQRGGTGVRPSSVAGWDMPLACGEQRQTLRVQPHAHTVRITLAGRVHSIELLSLADHHLRYAVDGVQRQTVAVLTPEGLQLVQQAWTFHFTEVSPYPAAEDLRDPRRARAPVAGTVAAVSVQPGDVVVEGQPLVCVEAMKMEMWLQAAASGRVRAVHVRPRDAVEAGAVLVELDLEAKDS
ncbi:acetyl/propionyl/methylcrotonyl-CoA carboxylase subunit alpha [Aquabacterium sp.]|uniref:acetyl/propionyl/methylcrotonyl-CoA carboxylase subunit alpha n=1 Tax=Aquabacterium sp. TaxID=1872578 RepID=UPI002B87C1E8|nr:biotin carboxylase N-terminal domain-containing protein [Aquabacterium sp.]HSW07652.1 biotin carboxylase N-terminal domain-containing protein [Aquabacterium sp.]